MRSCEFAHYDDTNEVVCQLTKKQVLILLEWYQSANTCQTDESDNLANFLYSVV